MESCSGNFDIAPTYLACFVAELREARVSIARNHSWRDHSTIFFGTEGTPGLEVALRCVSIVANLNYGPKVDVVGQLQNLFERDPLSIDRASVYRWQCWPQVQSKFQALGKPAHSPSTLMKETLFAPAKLRSRLTTWVP